MADAYFRQGFALAATGVFILRRKRPGVERPYRTPGYPVTPLVFIVISVWFVGNTLLNRPAEAWAGIAFLALGVPVFLFWNRKGGSAEQDQRSQ